MPSPGCTYWAELQAARDALLPHHYCTDSPQKGPDFSESLCLADDEWLQGATAFINLLKGVKVSMYQNSIMHTNRGKEGWLHIEVAPQLLHFDFSLL